jgi:endonuclease/exonuclease/phosphatase family metal-dependent hydrolase
LEFTVRLIAWNCCSGPLERKLAALEALEPDIAVIPECPRLPASRHATFWVGANRHKGLGVFAKPPWRIRPATRRSDLPRYVAPLRVTGPETFTLWAVWACHNGADRYVRGMHRAVDQCRRLFRRAPTVMLGDFNSNSIWDHENPPDRCHGALVEKLSGLGLISSYHAYYGETQGAETRPTFFEYRHQGRPYHIDYCFIPTSWTERISAVTLGAHAEWARRSDHMPLVVELAPG